MAKKNQTVTVSKGKGTPERLSEKEFVYKAIRALRTGNYKGIHAKYSGFNSGFKEYFGTDPVNTTMALQRKGELVVVPCKGGVMLYIPGEIPERSDNSGQRALAKIFT